MTLRYTFGLAISFSCKEFYTFTFQYILRVYCAIFQAKRSQEAPRGAIYTTLHTSLSQNPHPKLKFFSSRISRHPSSIFWIKYDFPVIQITRPGSGSFRSLHVGITRFLSDLSRIIYFFDSKGYKQFSRALAAVKSLMKQPCVTAGLTMWR
jgi:hypothetical protein